MPCRSLIILAALCLASSSSAAKDKRTACVFDPAGKSGDYYALMQDFALTASKWESHLDVRAYTDEATAAKDYEARMCDLVVATGVRLQRFNQFPSTIEAIGAISSYDVLRQMIHSVAKYESAAKRMRSGEHETVGIIPVGAVYLFVRDRSVDTVAELAGKRIATMDYDKAAPVMVKRVGAIMIPADLGSIGPKFNNGDVDAAYASAPAYKPFELWRGLGSEGGVVRLPLAQATLQLMARHERFPAGFGDKARDWFAGKFDHALGLVKKAESEIPDKYWIHLDSSSMPGFEEMFQEVRVELRDEHGAYDGKMLSALRMLRCAADRRRAECVEKKE